MKLDFDKDPKGFALYVSEITMAFVEGKAIECKPVHENDNGWLVNDRPAWNWQKFDYRIAQPKKPSINWFDVHPDFNVLVLDYSEQGVLSNVELVVHDKSWVAKQPCSDTVRICYAGSFASFKPGECAWQDSLVTRPGWVTEIIKRASK